MALPTLKTLPEIIASEKFNGAKGENRETQKRCQINANHDYEALQCWLNEYRAKPTTFRTYQKEAERFLLWSIIQLKKPLSSINREDMDAYIQFLDNPMPQELWCAKWGGRGIKRGDSNWRPFVGPLSQSAKMTALSALDSMFNYLVMARYLVFNPMALMRRRDIRQHFQQSALTLTERMLDREEWHAMLNVLDALRNLDEDKKYHARLIFIVNILYFLGLRVNELVTHTWNAFRKVDDRWWFYVFGKGDKLGRIPVNDELLRAIIHYRSSLKKMPYPDISENTPLIVSFTTGAAITARQVNKILKYLAFETAKHFSHEPERAKKIKKFSAHWLRHLSASMQDRAGIAFKHIRANHRHENDETTRRYVHALDEERHQDMQKLSLRINNLKD